jgi:Family of unknown function (DUF6594)
MTNNPPLESFQDFWELHIKSLLYYQDQLDQIQQDLHALGWKNHYAGGFRQHEKLTKDIKYVFRSEKSSSGSNEEREQLLMVQKMRTVLKDYSKLLF